MYATAYIPLINCPTRITKETFTLIDTIFMNNYDFKDSLYSGTIQTDISDHSIVFHLSETDIINSQKNENTQLNSSQLKMCLLLPSNNIIKSRHITVITRTKKITPYNTVHHKCLTEIYYCVQS